jgi:hypothetical protein
MAPITLDEIHDLPDNMDGAEIDRAVGEFLRGPDGGHSHADVAGALFQIAIRYTNVFGVPGHDARAAIVEWILRCWDDADVELSENILGIVAHLGLHEARHRMAESAKHSPQVYLREQFSEYLSTLGDPPWDPYKGYAK